jgi:uncharacterized protein (TIGR03437 family)
VTRLLNISSVLIAATVAARAQPAIVSVVNAASFQTGLPYGGSLATVFVSGLSGLTPGTYIAPLSGSLPYQLGGIEVNVNGGQAPLLAVAVPSDPSANVQVNFQVPLERNAAIQRYGASTFPGSGLSVTGKINSASMTGLPGVPFWGGFFSGTNGYASAVHTSDSSPVTQENPAHPGESIIAYADDFFLTWPPPPVGIPVSQQSLFQLFGPQTVNPYRNVTYLYLQAYPPSAGVCPIPGAICGQSGATNTPAVQITFEGLAPGTAGVEEIDFVVPANQQPGNWPLFFDVGSCPDGSGVPGTCGSTGGNNSPYVLLPVG